MLRPQPTTAIPSPHPHPSHAYKYTVQSATHCKYYIIYRLTEVWIVKVVFILFSFRHIKQLLRPVSNMGFPRTNRFLRPGVWLGHDIWCLRSANLRHWCTGKPLTSEIKTSSLPGDYILNCWKAEWTKCNRSITWGRVFRFGIHS